MGMVAGILTRDEQAAIAASLDGLPRAARVVVAMSGGVDSSVTAAVLKDLGFDVVGVTLQLYDHGAAVARKGACCAGQDIHDARRVADRLAIPHYVLDYEARFRAAVIDRFADSYLAGETPVPCVACNQSVKFGDLAETARELGAAALVTGHYVGWTRMADGPALVRAADADRDQSYFLFSTPATQLEFLRFPLGGLSKPTVRRLAETLALPVAAKPDSQDICFVPSGRYTDIIERLRPGAAEPGEVVHVDGRRLGRHPGIVHFTVGQRRGLGIAAASPLYVVALEPEHRRVIVGPREALLVRRIRLSGMNWLGPDALERVLETGRAVHARVRSTQAPQPARVAAGPDGPTVTLDAGEHGVARGQACVLYDSADHGARLLGGGWIAATAGDAAISLPVAERAVAGTLNGGRA